jgi:chitinase
MAYDMHWNGEKITNFHSALFHDPADPSKPPQDSSFADHAVKDFLRMGVPARKLVLGLPFYGKAWAGVADVNHGLYQPAKGESKSPPAYRNLKSLPASADRQFDPKAGSCSVWNDGEFFSYDCPEAVKTKMQYIRKHGLGGVMFWELGQDTPDAELVKTLAGK